MDAFRAQLDELMGKDRNLLPHEKKGRGQHFSDPDVCKNYICGFCPSELFTNTKSDLGPCHKQHDDQCREQYMAEKNKSEYPFEADWIHYLERLVQDLDKKIKKAHDRLDTQDTVPDAMIPPESKAQIEDITAQIQNLLKQMEELGEEGRVDEAQGLMRIIDKLKAEKEILLRGGIAGITGNGMAALSGLGQEKKMRVCETCGAFLVVGDTEKRMASHLEGKQHQGYAKIRQAIEDYHKKKGDEGAARRRSTGANAVERGDRDHRDNYHPYKRDNRDRERDSRDGDRYRERDRYDRGGRDYRDRDRDRDRDRRDYNRGGGGYRDDRKRRDDDR